MYQDAIELLGELVKSTPGLKGIRINQQGKPELQFYTETYKAKDSLDMLDKIETKKTNN